MIQFIGYYKKKCCKADVEANGPVLVVDNIKTSKNTKNEIKSTEKNCNSIIDLGKIRLTMRTLQKNYYRVLVNLLLFHI